MRTESSSTPCQSRARCHRSTFGGWPAAEELVLCLLRSSWIHLIRVVPASGCRSRRDRDGDSYATSTDGSASRAIQARAELKSTRSHRTSILISSEPLGTRNGSNSASIPVLYSFPGETPLSGSPQLHGGSFRIRVVLARDKARLALAEEHLRFTREA